MKQASDTIALHNGYAIPCVGYGTYLTQGEEAEKAVETALECGYRHIDTAAFYQNEEAVGRAVRNSDISRKEIFITSKVWNEDRGYETTKKAFEQTCKRLGVSVLDLYLIHWPANRKQFGDEARRINADTWRAMEELYEEGAVRAIGVSNFMPHHIEELMQDAHILPMVNQIECHPGWLQKECMEYCQKKHIVVEAWSPLGRKEVLEHELLQSLADAYGRSSAQICIRWALQHGVVPLPKTVSPARMKENADVFDFCIRDEDMRNIDALCGVGGRCFDPDEVEL